AAEEQLRIACACRSPQSSDHQTRTLRGLQETSECNSESESPAAQEIQECCVPYRRRSGIPHSWSSAAQESRRGGVWKQASSIGDEEGGHQCLASSPDDRDGLAVVAEAIDIHS